MHVLGPEPDQRLVEVDVARPVPATDEEQPSGQDDGVDDREDLEERSQGRNMRNATASFFQVGTRTRSVNTS